MKDNPTNSCRMKHLARIVVVAGILSGISAAREAGADPAKQRAVEFATPGFVLKFLPDRAWTYSQIRYEDYAVGEEKGFYGAAVATQPGLFTGTGHGEGGFETVESVEIVVDGKQVDAAVVSGTVPCKEATIVKHSRMAHLHHTAVVTLEENRIELHSTLKAVERGFLDLAYPFMFCWNPDSTEWMALRSDGVPAEGRFASDEKWHLEQDVKWTSIYFPAPELAMVVVFPDDLPPGKIHKHGYFDRTMYHKQYYQAWWRADIENGQEIDCRATLLPVQGAPDRWKANVRAEMARRPR